MSVFWLDTSVDAKVGGFKWSETTTPRKVTVGANWWAARDADRAPLGPYPDDIKADISKHWALTHSSDEDLPDIFNAISPGHFTGAPIVQPRVSAVFQDHAQGDIELLALNQMWSLSKDAPIKTPHSVVNFYGAVNFVDLEKNKVIKAQNPNAGRLYVLGSKDPASLITHQGAQGDRHLWRDKNTSEWFCDAIFRDAMEQTLPGTFTYRPIGNKNI